MEFVNRSQQVLHKCSAGFGLAPQLMLPQVFFKYSTNFSSILGSFILLHHSDYITVNCTIVITLYYTIVNQQCNLKLLHGERAQIWNGTTT